MRILETVLISVILQKRFRNAHTFAYRLQSNGNKVQVSTLSGVADNKRRHGNLYTPFIRNFESIIRYSLRE
jgi:hypothetical protein